MNDCRVEETRKIVEALVTKSMFKYTKVLIMEDTVTIIVNQTLLYKVPLKTISDYYYPIAFLYSDIIDFEDPTQYTNDNFLINDIQFILNYYINIKNTKPIVAIDNELRNNEEFENLLNLSSDQGMKYFRLPGLNLGEEYLIPMFAGFINLSKPDTIGMKIYDIQDGFLLLEMDINKKKINRDIQVYCRIMKI